jgi:hypothetical protein
VPGWGDILAEIQAEAQANNGQVNIDAIRRKYLTQLHALTGRSVVVYATDFLGKGGPQTSIQLSDMQGLMEVFKDLPGPNLDLVLHSPGGQAEATDRLVRYMRSKFDHVRVFVPLAAMSAATMWSMAADEIVMGKHSQLGPIDPQITLPNGIPVPAGALLEQFREAGDECAKDPSRITGWLPTLQQYPPGLLNVCESAAALSKRLVAEWLKTYMFAGDPKAAAKARTVAAWLCNDRRHLSHSRAITRDELEAKKVRVTYLEDDPALQDAVLSVHHAVMHTFGNGSAVKIIENNLGRAYVQHGGLQLQVPLNAPRP